MKLNINISENTNKPAFKKETPINKPLSLLKLKSVNNPINESTKLL